MYLKRFQHLVCLSQNDMIAIRRLDNTRHLTILQGESNILKLLDQLAALYEWQQSSLTS